MSIVNQFDELHPVLPDAVREASKDKIVAVPIQCALVTVWERSKAEISESSSMRVELVSPSGKKLAQFGADLDMRKFRRVRNIGNMPGLALAGEGIYTFKIKARHGTLWRNAGTVTYLLKYGNVQAQRPRRRVN